MKIFYKKKPDRLIPCLFMPYLELFRPFQGQPCTFMLHCPLSSWQTKTVLKEPFEKADML